MKENQTRNNIVTAIKVLATVLVLYIHGANIFGYAHLSMPIYMKPFFALANTAVPAFMAVSGYLIFKKNIEWKVNLNKKIKRLAIPFLIWSCFWVVIEAIGSLILPGRFENVFSWGLIDFLKGIIGIPFYISPLYGPLWYVRDLYILSLLAPLCQELLKKRPLALVITAILLWFSPFPYHLREAFTFFIIGGLMSTKKEWSEKLRSIPSISGCLFSLLVGAVLSLIGNDYATRLALFFMLLGVYCGCKKISTISSCQKWFDFLIPYSFMIYVFHGKVLSIIQILFTTKFDSSGFILIGYFIIPLIVFFICLFVAMVFKKMLPRVYAVCTGEKASNNIIYN